MTTAEYLRALAGLDAANDDAPCEEPFVESPASVESDPRELVVTPRGRPRQAGTVGGSSIEGAWITSRRRVFEANLYEFAKAILGRDRLTTGLHLPTCDWLQHVPPYRKLLLMPRDHYKSTIVSKSLPIHVHVQPRESNVYFPGRLGVNVRVLLAGETDKRASGHVAWVKRQWESNKLLRAFWPHAAYDKPLRDAPKWNESEIMLPRTEDYSESSLTAVGVGGAITGAHFDMLLEDDLTTLAAANSPVVMQTAIDWHVASQALLDDVAADRPDKSLNFIVGTKWTAADLPQFIMDNEPDVAVTIRSILEDGKPILPEVFSPVDCARLEQRYGVLYHFMYMNQIHVAGVTDFDISLIRQFTLDGAVIRFLDDPRDASLVAKMDAPAPPPRVASGTRLTRDVWQTIYRPGEGLRLRCN